MPRRSSLLILLSACAAPALAQSPPATPPPAPATTAADVPPPAQAGDLLPWHRDDVWTVRFEPAVYYVAMSGTATLPRSEAAPGSNPSIRLAEIDLDEPRLSPLGEVNLRNGDWRISVRGFGFSSSQDALTNSAGALGDISFASGDPVNRSLDFNAFELEGAYTLLQNKFRPLSDGSYAIRTRFDVIGGLRVYDVDLRLTSQDSGGSLTSQHEEAFLQGLVGVKGSLEIYDQFTVDLQLGAGGSPDGYSFDILVGGSWKPIDNFGVQIGYRALFFDVESGSGNGKFALEGAAQGLYAGIVLEF